MSELVENWLFIGFIFLCGVGFGWLFSHSTVATECQKLGSFYVGDKVYVCAIRGEGK